MLCPRCYGKHTVEVDGKPAPCPECGGWGDIHCCDGLREQESGPAPKPSANLPVSEPPRNPGEQGA